MRLATYQLDSLVQKWAFHSCSNNAPEARSATNIDEWHVALRYRIERSQPGQLSSLEESPDKHSDPLVSFTISDNLISYRHIPALVDMMIVSNLSWEEIFAKVSVSKIMSKLFD